MHISCLFFIQVFFKGCHLNLSAPVLRMHSQRMVSRANSVQALLAGLTDKVEVELSAEMGAGPLWRKGPNAPSRALHPLDYL